MQKGLSLLKGCASYHVFAISVFHRLSMRYCDICRFFLRYYGICRYFLRYCGVRHPPMSPSYTTKQAASTLVFRGFRHRNRTDDLIALQEMWEKSLQQENERFEKSMKMFQENQKMQMEQLLLYPDLKI